MSEVHVMQKVGKRAWKAHFNVLTDRPDLKEWGDMEEKKPMTIEELSTKVDGLVKTIDNLAVLVQTGFVAMESKIDAVDKKVDVVKAHLETQIDRQFEELKERTFNAEEKEGIVAVVDAVNQQLEDSALGVKDITLTRTEYERTAVAADFPNRFAAPVGASMD